MTTPTPDQAREAVEFLYERAHVIEMARKVLASPPPAQPATDPMGTPLPCDVKVGNGTHRKGTSLRALVNRMQMLHEAAFGPEQPQAEKDANLAVLQGAAQPPREPVQPLSEVNWMPFALTVAAGLDRGDDARMLFDENSPLRDELRRLIALERKRP
jgi:hypothetical protein